jgi:hypothetical protein
MCQDVERDTLINNYPIIIYWSIGSVPIFSAYVSCCFRKNTLFGTWWLVNNCWLQGDWHFDQKIFVFRKHWQFSLIAYTSFYFHGLLRASHPLATTSISGYNLVSVASPTGFQCSSFMALKYTRVQLTPHVSHSETSLLDEKLGSGKLTYVCPWLKDLPSENDRLEFEK